MIGLSLLSVVGPGTCSGLVILSVVGPGMLSVAGLLAASVVVFALGSAVDGVGSVLTAWSVVGTSEVVVAC